MDTPKAIPTAHSNNVELYKTANARDFLNHFDPRQRGHIANLFLDPVRNGMTEPHRIVSAVRSSVSKRNAPLCKTS